MAPPPPSPEPSDGQEQADPAPRPPESLGEASVRQPSTPATGPLDVLLVEDDPVARTYLTEILRSRGHNVESLEEGGGAVEAFVRARHPMVILDRALPDTTGVEICRRIREDPEAEDTFVLFVTAAETQDALDEALQAGADDYVVKPVSPDLLHTRIGIAERRIREIREHRRIQAELRKASYRDQLTGLGNRTMLRDRIEKSAGRARRDPDHVFAVLLVDLDGFHGINERHGREVSDQVLREVGNRIAGSVRDLDTPVRIAADEFGVHLSDVKNESDPTRVAGRIQESLASPIEIDGRRVHVSGCIGIALGSAESSGGTEATLRSARKALTRAKSRGRGEVQIFDPEVHARAMARVELEREIRQGLENEELALHYQPILDLSTGRMHAVEALLRWRRPDDELTLPSDFIPVAEESGLIVPLGWWTLETACRQGRAWRDAPSPGDPIRISVNVSTRQFVQPDVDEIVARTLERTGLPADALHLELTETSVMANGEDAVQTLQRLKELGVRLHVDDFGTGYSSLSYLCRLPIDSLKVDRTFIEAMTDSRENREVVRTIVQLAGNLGMTVIAEGVETPEQEELLREMGCDYVQGYLYHRPMADEAIERLLTGHG